MPKIKPKSVLPYVKPVVVANPEARSVNTSNALSTDKQPNTKIIKDLFGAISAAASYSEYIGSETSGHLGTALRSWRDRKN